MTNNITPIHEYKKYWAECFGTAPFLPTSRKEMDALGWDSCDIIIVTGDAYVDHPSFGMAIIGRLLEAQGLVSVSLLNQNGKTKMRSCSLVSQICSSGSLRVTWTP